MQKPNKIRFELIDNVRNDRFNETTIMEKQWYGESETGEVLDIETFHTLCKEFAAAMGYQEKTIEEWFGEN